jgi:hypothetical protein
LVALCEWETARRVPAIDMTNDLNGHPMSMSMSMSMSFAAYSANSILPGLYDNHISLAAW